jgi:hypothetical protein
MLFALERKLPERNILSQSYRVYPDLSSSHVERLLTRAARPLKFDLNEDEFETFVQQSATADLHPKTERAPARVYLYFIRDD